MTDNDRDLIELAAKAYGIQVKGWINDKLIGFDTNTEQPVNGDWNPLENDGDAFRLAVQLRIVTQFLDGFKQVRSRRYSDRDRTLDPHNPIVSATGTQLAVLYGFFTRFCAPDFGRLPMDHQKITHWLPFVGKWLP